MILQLADELQYHKKEVQVLRSEKETLKNVRKKEHNNNHEENN